MLSAQYTSGNSEAGVFTPVINTNHLSGLVSFTSDIKGRDLQLKWITVSELNISVFEVERAIISNKKSKFIKIGFATGLGTINAQTVYLFEDKNLQSGKYQYRLRQIDNKGNVEYYNLNGNIEVGLPTKFEISQESPNPLNETRKVYFSLPNESKVTIKYFDTENKKVITLLNEVRTAGFHSFQVFVPDISISTYYYCLKAESKGNETIILSRSFNNKKSTKQ